MSTEVRFEDGRSRFNKVGATKSRLSREEALSRADTAMVRLTEKSGDWINAEIGKLADAIRALPRERAAHPDTLYPVYKSVRCLRDLSGNFGMPSLSLMTELFCELVSRMSAAGQCHVDALTTQLAALELVWRGRDSGLPLQEIQQLADNLQTMIDHFPDPEEEPTPEAG